MYMYTYTVHQHPYTRVNMWQILLNMLAIYSNCNIYTLTIKFWLPNWLLWYLFLCMHLILQEVTDGSDQKDQLPPPSRSFSDSSNSSEECDSDQPLLPPPLGMPSSYWVLCELVYGSICFLGQVVYHQLVLLLMQLQEKTRKINQCAVVLNLHVYKILSSS